MKGANDVEVFGASADNWRHNRIHYGCIQESVCTAEANGGIRRFARAYRRIWEIWIITIIVSISIPTNAFAATGNVLNYNDMAVVWGPNPVGRWGSGDSDDNGVIVVANSMYNAAIVTCGYDVLDSRLTHDVKAKLSNATTGGNFYTFAQTFECFQGQDGYNYPSWNRSGTGVVDTIASLYGSSNVWWSIYDSYLLQSAKEDLEAILNGEDLGGGSGSGGTDGDYLVISGTPFYDDVDTTSYYLYLNDGTAYKRYTVAARTASNNSDYALFNSNINIQVSMENLPDDFPKSDGYARVILNSGYIDQMELFPNATVEYDINNYGSGGQYIKKLTANNDYYYYSGTIRSNQNEKDNLSVNINHTFSKSPTVSSLVEMPNVFKLILPYHIGNDEPVVPPTNWPEDPTPTPTEPPEVPEPPTTTPPTQPTPPTSPTPPTYQPQPVYVTSNFTVDLQGVLDAMDEHCQHIQNALYQNSKNLYEDLATYLSDKYADLKLVLDGNFGYIGDTIDDGFEDLKNYLWDLFKWLKRNMDFTFTAPEYDDSSVLSWLKKIYSKMGTGIRSKPVDPVVDPVGAWNWLEQLIQGILGALSNAVGGLAGTVGDLFDGIKDKFPFSIPWDLVAILALFDAAPVTPQAIIDYTIFEDGPITIPVHWDINLHYLDDTMGTIRAMEDIVFCFYLLLKTDWLSNVFDGIGDYLGGKFRTAMRS